MLVDAPVRVLLAQGVDQPRIPAGMDNAKTPGVDEQRQFVEPLEKVMPVAWMLFELGQGFVDQPAVARGVLAHVVLAALGQRRGVPAQGVVLVVAHDAVGLAGLDHVMDDVQRFANPRATVDDVAKEHGLARRMPPDATLALVAEGVEQAFEGMCTAVHVTDQVETASGIEHHSPPPPRRLPQPSLVRHTS